MSQNSDHLKRHVKAAQTVMTDGLEYSANDNDAKYWAVSTQKIDGVQTGNIVVVCVDDNALTSLTADLRAEGYSVEEHPGSNEDAGALVITPPKN